MESSLECWYPGLLEKWSGMAGVGRCLGWRVGWWVYSLLSLGFLNCSMLFTCTFSYSSHLLRPLSASSLPRYPHSPCGAGPRSRSKARVESASRESCRSGGIRGVVRDKGLAGSLDWKPKHNETQDENAMIIILEILILITQR